MCKIGSYWEAAIYHREFTSMLCDDLNVKEIQNRGDMCIYMGFPGGSAGKELPAMQETPVQFLG